MKKVTSGYRKGRKGTSTKKHVKGYSRKAHSVRAHRVSAYIRKK